MKVKAIKEYYEPLRLTDVCSAAEHWFQQHQHANFIPVLDGQDKPVGVITRAYFVEKYFALYGRDLYHKKSITRMMSTRFVVVNGATPLNDASELIAQQSLAHISEGLIVVGSNQSYSGVVPGVALIKKLLDLNLRKQSKLQKAYKIIASNETVLEQQVKLRTEELSLALASAEKANSVKTEFMSNMTHEIRTPLHSIVSFARIAKKKMENSKPEALDEYLEKIIVSSNRLEELLNNILALVDDASKNIELSIGMDDIQSCLNDVIQENQAACEARHIKLECDFSSDNTALDFDRKLIFRALNHMLENAINYGGDGKKITLKATKKGQYFIIELADQGPGVPDSEKQSIFDPFYIGSHTRTGAGGKGLGLSVASMIVRHHHGMLEVSDNTPHGACFRMKLPLQSSASKA